MLSANNSLTWVKKQHSLMSKWNILFDKSPEWISFKPQLGLKVYPCYSCKNMFSSKLTFQDHINRRVVIIKYKCNDCTNTFTFYNRCSFLLHARKHFSLSEGTINLANVDISLLPVELAGFARHESVPFLYDEEEEYCNNAAYINCQFYTPDENEAGKQNIMFKPFNLVFHYAEGTNNVLLILKQITTNVPLCQFVTNEVKSAENSNIIHETEIKQEVLDGVDEFTIPVISKIESLNESGKTKCTECLQRLEIPIASHFLGNNKPLDESLCCYVCKYIAPTKCSLQSHVRTHEKAPPFVCPDCGKDFATFPLLHTHMDDICFHLSKHVRFRCPAQKCGKLFVMRNTYASHFINHFQSIFQCSFCKTNFFSENDFEEHSKTHDGDCTSLKIFNCVVCKSVPHLTEDKFSEHINWHLQAREGYVYIYTCKLCRSYFRSNTTYFVHKQRCAKNDKSGPLMSTNCQFCSQKLVHKEKDAYKTCTFCKQINNLGKDKNGQGPQDEKNKTACMLCKEELAPELVKNHEKVCKYNNPIVPIPCIAETNSDETSSSEKFSDAESKQSYLDTSGDSLKNDSNKSRKRKRSSVAGTKSKKATASSDESFDLQAEKPVSFDGTYYCKVCDFKSSERELFHKHIVEHRDVSTAYQCMECGECFVVKPSLIKHLTHYHKISDTNEYLAKNDCYDKSAIEELETNLKLVPGEHRGPLKENQCTVCLEQFDDSLSLSKHFRIHGMAFLKRKTK